MASGQDSGKQDLKLYQYNLPICIDPGETALIVVDMQNDFIHPEGVLGRRGFDVEDLDNFVDRIGSLMKAFKSEGMPVIATRHIIQKNGAGEAVGGGLWVEMRQFLKRDGFREGTWGAQLIDGLELPDYIIDKPRFSAFYQTCLEALLRGLDIRTIVFSGVATNVCVDSTIRDAFFRDFHVVTVQDCVAAYSREANEASLVTLRFLGAVIKLNDLEVLLKERRS